MTRKGWVACEICGAEYRSQTAAEGCCAEKKAGDDDNDDTDSPAVTDGGRHRRARLRDHDRRWTVGGRD